jgi:glyoxylate reductase
VIQGKVFVTRMVHQDAIDLLRQHFTEVDVWENPLPPSPEELVQRASGCIALITMLTEKVDHVLFDAVPDLKVVANVAVGYDNLDVPEARRRGIKLGNTPDVLTEATADLTFASCWGRHAEYSRLPRTRGQDDGVRGIRRDGWVMTRMGVRWG